ncbi:hypothetical protein JTE90_028046 [Oedothorax gibbosus]|uniref:Uncharacterized protein n=1 Tax=Oedothorax gibbosus TaxID=931172 RepID=A0AAV6UH27_9ARAC|nr:hypothetical protein JTE90_028046 [Oedothorax gibbosus]
MARLAAYYQEDFHYPLSNPGHKQRKSSYIVYEEPKNNVFNGYSFNRERIRGLAASEPSLDLPQTLPEAMALQKRIYQHQGQVYQNYPYQYENVTNWPQSNHHFTRHEPEVYDNESIFSYNELPQHDNQHNQRFRSRSRKRFSYAEPNDMHSPELMYIPNNGHRHRTRESQDSLDLQYYNERQYQPDNYFIDPISQCQSTPVHFRPESRQAHWGKHHFIHANANPVFLSPPSPLDSGLSSQSIGSNPSLDVEHSSENLHIMRSGRHSACSCTRLPNYDNRQLNGRDFGETSPIAYSLSQSADVPQQRYSKKGTVSRRKHSSGDYDAVPLPESQVRYGKLGLIGEPTKNQQRTADVIDNNIKQRECQSKDRMRYVHSDDSDVSQQITTNIRRKKPSNNFTRPCVIVINGPEKNKRQPSSSPDNQEDLSDADDKSQGPESPMSVTVSNSDSAPSSLEQEEPPKENQKPTLRRRQSCAELEIRELEAMYARCNLGDRDLLDRAERRDLPTAHQQNRLPRSRSSDALCETLYFNNPYEPIRRAPPLRRSGLPDRIADDMALRKLHRHSSRRQHQSNVFDNPITYMLCSAHFTPPMCPPEKDILLMDNPDVELDDLCYRKNYFGKETKQDPEPPFGIPLRPPPTQKVCISDYLHSVPSSAPRPLCHPRGNPDVVRDDMAFRTLRKDEPEREFYDISQIYKHKKR